MIALEERESQSSPEMGVWEDVGPRRKRLLTELYHNPGIVAGVAIMGILVLASLAAPLIAGHNPDGINIVALNQSPSGSHWFGTDYLGRDLWSRVVFGGRISLPAGLGVVVIGASIGIPLGLVAGYIGGLLDDIFMRLMDIILAFPGIVLSILVVGILAPGLTSAVIAIGVTSIPFFARFVRGSTLSTKELDYVTAARVMGTRGARVVRRHIFPNVVGPLIVLAATTFGYAILSTAALSFLGLGSQPPTSDWGVLLSEGYDHMFQAASEVIFPGLAILFTVMSVNLAADGLSGVLNTRG